LEVAPVPKLGSKLVLTLALQLPIRMEQTSSLGNVAQPVALLPGDPEITIPMMEESPEDLEPHHPGPGAVADMIMETEIVTEIVTVTVIVTVIVTMAMVTAMALLDHRLLPLGNNSNSSTPLLEPTMGILDMLATVATLLLLAWAHLQVFPRPALDLQLLLALAVSMLSFSSTPVLLRHHLRVMRRLLRLLPAISLPLRRRLAPERQWKIRGATWCSNC
jgi:hypothetical protein